MLGSNCSLFLHRRVCNDCLRYPDFLALSPDPLFAARVTLGLLGQASRPAVRRASMPLLRHLACMLHLTSPKTLPGDVLTHRETWAHDPLYQLWCWLLAFTNHLQEKHNVNPFTPENRRTVRINNMSVTSTEIIVALVVFRTTRGRYIGGTSNRVPVLDSLLVSHPWVLWYPHCTTRGRDCYWLPY